MLGHLELFLHDAFMETQHTSMYFFILIPSSHSANDLREHERYPPMLLLGCSPLLRQPIEGGREYVPRPQEQLRA